MFNLAKGPIVPFMPFKEYSAASTPSLTSQDQRTNKISWENPQVFLDFSIIVFTVDYTDYSAMSFQLPANLNIMNNSTNKSSSSISMSMGSSAELPK